jgi:2-polyprenyl-3-methyl-5-hydroxy-6-metoxy-1,4-benzoquinol methylase
MLAWRVFQDKRTPLVLRGTGFGAVRFRDRWLRQHYRALAGRSEDLLYSGKPFAEFAMAPFLDAILDIDSIRDALGIDRRQPRALEYGTGSGPGACHLAVKGFRVDAIDVSADAIDLARRVARSKNLAINFEVQDALALSKPPGSYDLVLDNHCLHHITSDEDRKQLLCKLCGVLKRNGFYVIETVVYHEGRDYGHDRFDCSTSTKWVRIVDPDPSLDPREFEDVRWIDGHWYWLRSRHRRPHEISSELVRAGFRVVYQSSFGGLLLCVRQDSELPVQSLERAIRQDYRDDPVAESIRLKYGVADTAGVK